MDFSEEPMDVEEQEPAAEYEEPVDTMEYIENVEEDEDSDL